MHEAEASVAYEPASQLIHVLPDVAPVVELAFPASHAKQVSDEVADGVELKRPAAHCVHEAEAAVAYVPASHLVQGLVSTVSLNFPAGQSSHSSA